MIKYFLFLLITAILGSCANDKKKAAVDETKERSADSTLLTNTSWGLINRNTDFAALQKIFGVGNVSDERICGPECIDSIDVTIVFSNTNKELVIYWKDSLYHKAISLIECYAEEAPYHTATGFKMGTSLQELLKANGQKIIFSGFDWDYGGYITSYSNGQLATSNIHYQLDLNDTTDYALLGDAEFHTDMPVVKKYLDKIVVSKISLSFNE